MQIMARLAWHALSQLYSGYKAGVYLADVCQPFARGLGGGYGAKRRNNASRSAYGIGNAACII